MSGAAPLLRRPAPADLAAVLEVHGDPRANAHNPAGPMRDLDEARDLLDTWLADWRERGLGYWAVEEDAVVGFGGVRFMGEVLNLYYRLRPEVWGRGIARHVAREAVATAHVLGGL